MRFRISYILRTSLLCFLLYLIYDLSADHPSSKSYLKHYSQNRQILQNHSEQKTKLHVKPFGEPPLPLDKSAFNGEEVSLNGEKLKPVIKYVYNKDADPMAGTVASLKYFNPDIPEPHYDGAKLGNYEPDNPCKNSQYQRLNNKNNGECGSKVVLTDAEKQQVGPIVKKFGFNLVASDKVELDRLPDDLRNEECKHWNYPENKDLNKATVIMVFYNEAWGPLMRTVHTVIRQSPKELLANIVMVDDNSNRKHLQEKLVDYINTTWPDGFVKLYRNSKREGLIRARINGAVHSQGLPGQILVYLDAHSE